jgi:hypothetical protein
MFYELRDYTLRPGTRERWVSLMQDQIVPFQQSQGMQVVGCFTVPEQPESFIWIRRFENEEQRVAQYDSVYKSSYWTEKIKPQIDEMLLRELIKVTRLEPTSAFRGTATLESPK